MFTVNPGLPGSEIHTIYLALVAEGYSESEATWGRAGARIREQAAQASKRGPSRARRYDNLHNEGGEGFNPYRDGR